MSSGLFRVTHTRDDGAMPDDEVRRARPNVSAGPTGPPQRGRPATRPLTCRWHGYCGAWLCSRTRDPVPPDAASLVRADRGFAVQVLGETCQLRRHSPLWLAAAEQVPPHRGEQKPSHTYQDGAGDDDSDDPPWSVRWAHRGAK